MKNEIKCTGNCGKVLGVIEIPDNEEYKGDAFYGMYCLDCDLPEPQESEIDKLNRQLQEIINNLNP